MTSLLYVMGNRSIAGGIESLISSISKTIDLNLLYFTTKDEMPTKNTHPIKIQSKNEIDSEKSVEKMLEAYANIEDNIDLIHIHCPNLIAGTILASEITNKPVISTYHYGSPAPAELGDRNEITLNSLENSDKIICISKAGYDSLQEIPDSKKLIIYNGIDIQKFLPKENKKQDNILKMIYPAKIFPQKGQHYLIEMAGFLKEKNPNFRMDCIGQISNEDYMYNLKRDIKNNSLEENIRFLPPVPIEKMPFFYQNYDTLLFPSLSEGLGLISLEAQSSGLPVIAFKTGGIPETIKEGKTGFIVEKGSSYGLAMRALRYLENPPQLKKMGENAREHIKNSPFLEKTMIEKHKELYKTFE